MGTIKRFLLARFLAPLVTYTKGKKTLTGIVAIVLWLLIYVIPVAFPEASSVREYALDLQKIFESNGIELSPILQYIAAIALPLGLADKLVNFSRKIVQWIEKKT